MLIVTTLFDYLLGDYGKVYDAFQRSVQKNCPDAQFKTITDLQARRKNSNKERKYRARYAAFAGKLAAYEQIIDEPDDIVLIDNDTLILTNLSQVFTNFNFDIAYTVRSKPQNKTINSGVVFVRNTPAAKTFIRQWIAADDRMYLDEKFHKAWRTKYRGMNQASLGYMVNNPGDAVVLPLPCSTYNACEEEWPRVSKNTAIVHLKIPLREVISGKRTLNACEKRYPGSKVVHKIWSDYAQG